MHDEKCIFKGYKALGIDSDYCGNVDIKPHGEISNFRAYYNKIIYGNTELEASIIMGLSACVVGYLSVFVNDVVQPSIIFDINGKSTTGKTTCARLAISVGGALKGGKDKTSLSGTCSTTANALYGLLDNNFGYPMLFDETGRFNKMLNFSEMIYSLADGTNKTRMKADGKVSPPKHWATTIIFTGEFSLLSKAEKADGLSVRVIPFNNVKWTKDKDQAHDVEKLSAEYAGLPIQELAKFMHGLSPETVKDIYKSEIAALTSKIPLDQCYQERAAKSIAVLTTTAKLTAIALNITFHEKEILEFFLENLKGGVPENESRRAFDFITNKCYEYQSKFPDYHIIMNDKPNYIVAKKDCWGYFRKGYNRKDGKSESNTDLLVIVKDKFLQWMNEGEFNKDNILREWKELGILFLSKPDHYYSDVVLHKGAPKTKCLRIILDNNAYSFDYPIKRHGEILRYIL